LAWIYVLIAAVFEAAWTFSLKFLKFSELKTLRFTNFYRADTGLPVLLPLAGYIAFGIGNIYFFSLAMKQMPMATAYAVWTAATLVLIKISETAFLQQRISVMELFFILLIIVGIFGLKFYGQVVK